MIARSVSVTNLAMRVPFPLADAPVGSERIENPARRGAAGADCGHRCRDRANGPGGDPAHHAGVVFPVNAGAVYGRFACMNGTIGRERNGLFPVRERVLRR